MKIALTPALLLGLVGVASSFPCTWNGAGSSYVYEEVITNDNGGDCVIEVDSRHQQTTCCRCASEADCNAIAEVSVPTYDSQGCDLYPPQINIGESAAGAAVPAQWFTSTAQLEQYLASTVSCNDDCFEQPTCNFAVQYNDTNSDPLCGNTLVTVTSSDWCVVFAPCLDDGRWGPPRSQIITS